jgi:hypothetical protein
MSPVKAKDENKGSKLYFLSQRHVLKKKQSKTEAKQTKGGNLQLDHETIETKMKRKS